jgi:glycopeptide antibiotics resistance protein
MPDLILEFFQLFIVARHCDINDIISSWLGVCLGMIVYGIFQHYHRLFSEDDWRRLNGAILLYLLFLLFTGLRPFDFHFSIDGPLQKISDQMFIPFLAYFQVTNLWNLYDLIRTILYFIPISLYLSYRLLCRRYRWGSIVFFTSLLGFVFGLVIEGFQLYSATRVGDITDVLSYGLGGFLGAFLLYYFFQEILPSFQDDEDLTGEDMYISGYMDW